MTTSLKAQPIATALVDLRTFPEIASIQSDDPRDFAALSDTAATDFVRVYGEGRRCAVHIDRGASTLMVAHVDCVQPPSGTTFFRGSRMWNPVIDDRLGVCLGLRILPRLGIHVDLLLTTDEEVGQSTAALFRPTSKQHNWLFSFDRGGEDVVAYQYDCDAFREKLHEAGFTLGIGSSSCIVMLEHLGVLGANLGNGMAAYHSPDAYCDLEQLGRQLERFAKFHHANQAARLPLSLALPGQRNCRRRAVRKAQR